MKYLGLLLLVFFLALLNMAKAQTASSLPVTRFYTPVVKEKMDAGTHPAPANPQQSLPSKKEVPQKVKDLGKNAHVSRGKGNEDKLPGTAKPDVAKIQDRNKKYIKPH